MYVCMCWYVQTMVRLQVLYRARLGFQVRMRGPAVRQTKITRLGFVQVYVWVCVFTHARACMLAAGTLVTEINLCLQHTLKMVALSAGHKFRYIGVMVNSVFTTFSLIHTALPQGVLYKGNLKQINITTESNFYTIVP